MLTDYTNESQWLELTLAEESTNEFFQKVEKDLRVAKVYNNYFIVLHSKDLVDIVNKYELNIVEIMSLADDYLIGGDLTPSIDVETCFDSFNPYRYVEDNYKILINDVIEIVKNKINNFSLDEIKNLNDNTVESFVKHEFAKILIPYVEKHIRQLEMELYELKLL